MEYEKSIAAHNPNVAREWSILNGLDRLPTTTSYGSHYCAFWECPAGHVYDSEVKSRCIYGNGCHYCSGTYALPGNLASQNPEIVVEWNYEKNENLLPDMVMVSSHKIVWWKCEHSHEWKAAVGDRTLKGYGCPYCSGRRVISGETDLATLYPDLAAEWHPTQNGKFLPSDVKPFSNKKAYWICRECRYEWESRIADRTQGCGCPCCSGKVIVEGINDLQTTNWDLALEWNYSKNSDMLPTMVTAGSGKTVWWKCSECGYEWEAIIASRNAGRGCPSCANKVVRPGINDLAMTNPALAAEWHPSKNGNLTPQMVTASSRKKVWWLGKCGHEWKTNVYNRNQGNGCPVCSGTVALVGETDLATVNPELVEEWDLEKNGALIPQHVTGMSGISVWWKCDNGHSWKAKISDRALGKGCPYCWGRVPVVGETDLQTVNPRLAIEWHPCKNGKLTPQMVTAGSNTKVWWQCCNNSEHVWKALVNDRNSGRGCPYCSNKRVNVGENDLATTHPQIAAEWHPTLNDKLTPQMVVAGSHNKVWWKCTENPQHVWIATVKDRTSGGGCPFCCSRAVLAGDNDLATTNPKLASEWHPNKNSRLTPEAVTAGSTHLAWWKCSKCGYEWNSPINYRCSGQGKCPKCTGYKVVPERLI